MPRTIDRSFPCTTLADFKKRWPEATHVIRAFAFTHENGGDCMIEYFEGNEWEVTFSSQELE